MRTAHHQTTIYMETGIYHYSLCVSLTLMLFFSYTPSGP